MALSVFKALAVSSNARTNWITIALGVMIGVLSFFKIIPDLQTAQSLGKDVAGDLTHVSDGESYKFYAKYPLIGRTTVTRRHY